MARYVARRLGQALIVLVGVSAVVFVALRLGGAPALLMLPPEATEADRVRYRQELGLDRPVPVQYAVFLGRAVRGDFGNSLRYNQAALPLVLERLPATLELALAALGVALTIAIPAGVLCAVQRNSAYDNLSMLGVLFGQSVPVFWLGIMLILLLAVRVPLFPTSGRG